MIAHSIKDAIANITGKTAPAGLYGLVAQFDTPGDLVHACEKVRDQGYKYWDAHSPFPIHGMDEACCGITGATVGLTLQEWVNLSAYPLVIAGKPFNSLPAFMPVTFELTILFSAFGAAICMLLCNFLPMFYHPLFKSDRFKRATDDGFFISIEARDAKFDPTATVQLLESIGGKHIERVEA
jgi:hypothetical protein